MKINELRGLTDIELINKLEKEQQEYNKWYEVDYDYKMDLKIRNMKKIKKVLEERKVKFEFDSLNGWQII